MSQNTNQLSRNEEISLVYEHLNGVEDAPQSLLTEVSNLKGIENPVTEGEYADYRYQAVNDEKFYALVPEVMAAVSKLKYLRSFVSDAERKEVMENNDAIRVEVCKLIEKHAIPYILLDNVLTDIGGNIAGIFKGAVTTLNNKTGEMFMDLGRKHFNAKEVTMAHVAEYAEKLFEGKDAAKAEAADEAK
jgi:dGTP triphosphohydrolase